MVIKLISNETKSKVNSKFPFRDSCSLALSMRMGGELLRIKCQLMDVQDHQEAFGVSEPEHSSR